MAKYELGTVRTYICVSSSIANFREKLLKRTGLPEYHNNTYDRVIFFGLYHRRDWWRFILHCGQKKVFWCGSDILALAKHPVWQKLIAWSRGKHYCENIIEHHALKEMGIESEIRPMIFDDPNKFKVNFHPSSNPRLFASYHKGREDEYAPRKHPQVDYLNGYSEKQFDEKIKSYQGAVRFNSFDGFAETLAKSVLMGQYPVSRINYPHMACLQYFTLDECLRQLAKMKEPNIKGREYWLKALEENLHELLLNW